MRHGDCGSKRVLTNINLRVEIYLGLSCSLNLEERTDLEEPAVRSIGGQSNGTEGRQLTQGSSILVGRH